MNAMAKAVGLEIRAMVTRGGRFVQQAVQLDTPQAHEVRVRIVGAGICHTDSHVLNGNFPYPQPFVLGHEGSGVVDAVGTDVTSVAPGDHVVLTFSSCGQCGQCQHDHPAYCDLFPGLNFAGRRADGSATLRDADGDVHGSFFSQSSFATYALAMERNVIRVDRNVPLELLGPLGCGIQTGAGTVLNALRPRAGQSIAIFGSGAVGLSAILAARLAGCNTIVAVDVRASRLELATKLGATRVIDGGVESAREIIAALGHVDFAVDTTGIVPVIEAALASVKINGVCAVVGATRPGTVLPVDLFHVTLGRTLKGVIEGDSDPQKFIPYLIEEYRAGRFPFDQLVRYYEFEQIEQAFADMEQGETVKPILRVS